MGKRIKQKGRIKRKGLAWSWGILLVAGASFVIWRRHFEPRGEEIPRKSVSQEELMAFQKQQLEAQSHWMDSVATRWGWQDFNRSETGLLWRRVEGTGTDSIVCGEGEWVVWDVEARLSDSTVFMQFQGERPLRFRRLRDDVPRGFHALAGWAQPGDSIEALIPSHEGWGLTGWPGKVPQDAVVFIRFRARSMTPALMPQVGPSVP